MFFYNSLKDFKSRGINFVMENEFFFMGTLEYNV